MSIEHPLGEITILPPGWGRRRNVCLRSLLMRAVRAVGLVPAFLLVATAHAASPPQPNIAYDDGFVWYLAGRLAADLQTFQERSGIKVEPGFRADYEVIYHQHLVDCKGPLPALADVFRFNDLTKENKSQTANLAYVGRMEYEAWPIVQKWNRGILMSVLADLGSGKYGFFPQCVVEGFRLQNPMPNGEK
jgi:hypothetical protein